MSWVKASPLYTLPLVCSGLSILIVRAILFLHYSKILIILSLPVSTALLCTQALWGIVIAGVKLGRKLFQLHTEATVVISWNAFCFDWLLVSLFGCAHIAIHYGFNIWIYKLQTILWIRITEFPIFSFSTVCSTVSQLDFRTCSFEIRIWLNDKNENRKEMFQGYSCL